MPKRLPATDMSQPRQDRRKRRAADPSVAITVNIPASLRHELDKETEAMGWTRSGAIVAAVTAWLAQRRTPTDD